MWQWKTKICCHLLKNWESHIKTSHRLKGWVNLQMQMKTIFWLKAKDGIIWKHPAWIAEKIGHRLGSQVLEKQPEGYTNVVATGARRQPRPPWQSGETWRKAFPLPFWFFVPTEVTPRNGTIKALDICVRRKLPRLETLFSPSLPRVQKPKSEFSPAWHPTQGRGSESKHVGESVLVRKRVREGEDGGVVNAYGGNADKSECWRCKNF